MPNDSDSGFGVDAAAVADIGALVDMRGRLQDHMEAANPDIFPLAPSWREDREKFYRDRIDGPDGIVVVGRRAPGGIVAMGVGTIVRRPDTVPDRVGHIDDVWVEPECRGRGIARVIVRRLLKFFAEDNVEKLVLGYVAGNAEAEAFWARLGFRPMVTSAGADRYEVERKL